VVKLLGGRIVEVARIYEWQIVKEIAGRTLLLLSYGGLQNQRFLTTSKRRTS
jgi:hypothetical protein